MVPRASETRYSARIQGVASSIASDSATISCKHTTSGRRARISASSALKRASKEYGANQVFQVSRVISALARAGALASGSSIQAPREGA